MGEYAKRKHDGESVKIGTCESLYYLRWQDRDKVIYPFNEKKTFWFWRIPTPDEDKVLPGEYDDLLNHTQYGTYVPCRLRLKPFPKELAESIAQQTKGIVQLKSDKLGMLVNAPCYHGLKLPTNTDEIAFFWNGKNDPLHLKFLKNDTKELRIGVECMACGHMMSFPFNEIEPYIDSLWMKLRLLHQCTEYWYARNETPCPYSVTTKSHEGEPMEIYNIVGGTKDWHLDIKDECLISGTWEQVRDMLIASLPKERPNMIYGTGEDDALIAEAEEMRAHYLTKEDNKKK